VGRSGDGPRQTDISCLAIIGNFGGVENPPAYAIVPSGSTATPKICGLSSIEDGAYSYGELTPQDITTLSPPSVLATRVARG
jgi:hypothetical protein